MNKNVSLTLSLIIITGLIVFGGSFLIAMYFMDPKETEAQPHLGFCEGKRIYTSFEEAFRNPEDVCSLQIGEGNLTAIPAEIKELKNLTYLSIIRNELTTIPSEIGELENLVTLYLNFNNITTVPDEIGNLNKLQKLQLVENSLSSAEQTKVRQLLPDVDIRF